MTCHHKTVRMVCLSLLSALSACGGIQSAMDAQGLVAQRIEFLTWILFLGSCVIFLLVFSLLVVAIAGPRSWRQKIGSKTIIIIGGMAFPFVVLSGLLFYGFAMLAQGDRLAEADNPLRVSVVGERWWWRVFYHHADGSQTESANELRLPVGRVVEIELTSADVIHSFWLPAYAGKMDMIPGRTNLLYIRADQTGTVRGQCAEYCGGAHARMSFYAVAMDADNFGQWMEHERSDAAAPAESTAGGASLFLQTGCGGCHRIRGTAADGRIGPDLTHVGGRHSLGAGSLPNNEAGFDNWLHNHQKLKPDNLMPAFEFLTDTEITSLATYLASLE